MSEARRLFRFPDEFVDFNPGTDIPQGNTVEDKAELRRKKLALSPELESKSTDDVERGRTTSAAKETFRNERRAGADALKVETFEDLFDLRGRGIREEIPVADFILEAQEKKKSAAADDDRNIVLPKTPENRA